VKQLTAFLLCILFLFNLVGYRLFFHYLQQTADEKYQLAVDMSTYDESRIITVKINLDMPYLPENTAFERVDGEINVDGKIYKYVQRRVYNGQLVLQCLPDETRTKLRSSREEYFFYANNLAAHSGEKQSAPKSSIAKNLATDYDQYINAYKVQHSRTVTSSYTYPSNEAIKSFVAEDTPAQPPEYV
jgi:hypothetical protein